jgi:hypothetical protein
MGDIVSCLGAVFGIALRCRWPWLRWSPEPRPWSLVPASDDKDALALFQAGTIIRLGDGHRAKFWTDNWVPGGRSVQDTWPILSFVRNSGISVAAALENRRWVRDISGGLSVQAMGQYLQLWDLTNSTVPHAEQRYEAIWRGETDGKFLSVFLHGQHPVRLC